jgi:nucleotide-binding universal stress UspA family protein
LYKHLLAATDGSELASNAVRHAAALAAAIKAELTIVTVTPPMPGFVTPEVGYAISGEVFNEIEQANINEAQSILDAAVALAQPLQAGRLHVSGRQPYEGILEAARQTGADLIVMASHGRSGLDRLLLGSQAARILSLSEIPVLVVK